MDTTSTSATVNLTAQITDDLSGVQLGYVYFISPSGQHLAPANFYLSSGTNLDGTYNGTATIPAFTEPGTWTVYYVYVQDKVGNSHYYYPADLQALGFPTTLTVTSQEDSAAPILTGFSFSPTQVDTTSTSATVNLTAQITDDLSGVQLGYLYFISPSGQHLLPANFYLSSGTNLDGTYNGTATIPAFSEPGTWTVYNVYVQDNVGNSPLLLSRRPASPRLPHHLPVRRYDLGGPGLLVESSGFWTTSHLHCHGHGLQWNHPHRDGELQ